MANRIRQYDEIKSRKHGRDDSDNDDPYAEDDDDTEMPTKRSCSRSPSPGRLHRMALPAPEIVVKEATPASLEATPQPSDGSSYRDFTPVYRLPDDSAPDSPAPKTASHSAAPPTQVEKNMDLLKRACDTERHGMMGVVDGLVREIRGLKEDISIRDETIEELRLHIRMQKEANDHLRFISQEYRDSLTELRQQLREERDDYIKSLESIAAFGKLPAQETTGMTLRERRKRLDYKE